jgi:hypothetical protein
MRVNRHAIGLFQHVPQGTNGSFQQGRVGHVGVQALGLEQLAGLDDFLVALGRQGTIVPTGEFIF